MQIALKLYASHADYLPPGARTTNRLELDVAEGTTIAAVIDAHQLPRRSCHLVLVNGVFVPPAERATRMLAERDELAIWPPIAGG
jgi:thiamine biosynthesis protein ThiS